MNFFDLSDGSNAADTGTTFDSNPDIQPIPAGTEVQAMIESLKWDESEHVNGKFISIRWSVLKPSQYENRKIFQKVKVMETNTKVSDKAKKMLAAIDNNAGGKLAALGKIPDDADLERALSNKMMNLKLDIWQMKDDDNKVSAEGNWVKAVSARAVAVPTKPKTLNDEDIAL